MTKYLLKILCVLIVSSAVFIGCDDDDGATSINPDRIARFLNGEPTIEVSEASTDIMEIPVFINAEFNAPVTVNFEIEGDPSNFELLSDPNQVVIPAMERQGVILIRPIDNDEANVPQNSIIIRITGADSGFEQPSGVSIGHAEKQIIFIDDECPVDASAFAGTYSVNEVFTSGTNEGLTLAGAFGEAYQIDVVAEPGDDTNTRLVFNNSAGFNQYFPDGTAAFLDACPGAVIFDNGGALNVALFADMVIESASFQ